MSHGGHAHGPGSVAADRRWLGAALAVIVVFLLAEGTVGLVVHSLALVSDAGHLLSDALALGVAILVSGLAARPPRGRYTYGYARLDALSGQGNGLLLCLLALWFTVEAVIRLVHPPAVAGGPVLITALVGIVMNLIATGLAGRARADGLNVRGALAHLVNDGWAFAATAVAGLVVLTTGWRRADAVASLVVAALMARAGVALVRAAARVFLEAAPDGVEPADVAVTMTAVAGVAEVHDLHVWDLGAGEPSVSAHVRVQPVADCHNVAEEVRAVLQERHGIGHATLQVDHDDGPGPGRPPGCGPLHGPVHRPVPPAGIAAR